ncbi:MAG: flagellar export chaperone FliS [Aliidiomarina sp.]|uniref:flagellar export chaperone FliS n=1 Tax=Aliidiomarina sp. TaxID=1872439 RepID=UPI0025BA3FE5|nr:flagellar export chaperone FliS [Aliidiomarina sp.]MCH8501068.1 flagellar export chaperone FliS [Aliidiomarina sp.]
MYAMRGAAAYGRVSVESNVLSASPHQLISMLFDGAQSAIKAARLHMENGNIAEKGKAITKAIDIVNSGLLVALDKDNGGELAERLEALYNYISGLLLRANLNNSTGALDEAAQLLNEIGSAWKEIGQQAATAQGA